MDPNHRDRVAFLRLCSGEFRRDMKLKQSGTGKTHRRCTIPILFFAREREMVDEAWPGDIIGIPNHGVLRVGDTLSEGEPIVFTGIPELRAGNPAPRAAGRSDEAEASERAPGGPGGRRRHAGVQAGDRLRQWIVGVVGALQLDVLKSRLGGVRSGCRA